MLTAQAASFDCRQSSSKVEKLICSDHDLSKLDDALKMAYQKALEQSDSKQKVIDEQRQWLKKVRNACQDTSCMNKSYQDRIHDLTATPITDVPSQCNQQLRLILNESVDLARSIPATGLKDFDNGGDSDNVRTGYTTLIPDLTVALASAKCYLDAAKLLGQMRTSTDKDKVNKENVIARMAIEYASQNNTSRAINLFQTLTLENERSNAARGIIRSFVRTGDFKSAKDIAKKTEYYLLDDLIVFEIEYGYLTNAIAEADPKSNLPISTNARLLVIQEMARQGRFEESRPILDYVLSQTPDEEDTSASDWFWRELAYTYAKSGTLTDAMNAVEKIGTPLTRIQTYSRIAKVSKDREFSKSVLSSAMRVAESCHDTAEDRSCWLDWLNLARAYAENGDTDTALQLTKKPMAEAEFMIAEIATVRALQLDFSSAQRVLDSFPANDHFSPHYQNALEALAISEARVGEYQKAQNIFAEIPNGYIQSTIVMAAAAESPQRTVILTWLDLAKKIDSDNLQARAVQPLMAAFSRVDGVENAYKWLKNNEMSFKPFSRAKGRLGVVQGALGQVPGKEWVRSVIK
ncbi:lysozyme inhibitor LprI family protein [Sideroxydans lithotrophicus]|nr:lysozyme inhibitor LprI family protein [Sideroxydans lithotrophicus]